MNKSSPPYKPMLQERITKPTQDGLDSVIYSIETTWAVISTHIWWNIMCDSIHFDRNMLPDHWLEADIWILSLFNAVYFDIVIHLRDLHVNLATGILQNLQSSNSQSPEEDHKF